MLVRCNYVSQIFKFTSPLIERHLDSVDASATCNLLKSTQNLLLGRPIWQILNKYLQLLHFFGLLSCGLWVKGHPHGYFLAIELLVCPLGGSTGTLSLGEPNEGESLDFALFLINGDVYRVDLAILAEVGVEILPRGIVGYPSYENFPLQAIVVNGLGWWFGPAGGFFVEAAICS